MDGATQGVAEGGVADDEERRDVGEGGELEVAADGGRGVEGGGGDEGAGEGRAEGGAEAGAEEGEGVVGEGEWLCSSMSRRSTHDGGC